MAAKPGELKIVEVIQPFRPGLTEVAAGTRLWAWQAAGQWHVVYNGADLAVPAGTVGEPDSPEVKQAAQERRSAREEEYQSAPQPPKA